MPYKSVSYTIKRKGIWKIRPFKKNECRFVNVKKIKNNIEKEFVAKFRARDISKDILLTEKIFKRMEQ
jgi:hypothetical protein